MSAADPHGEGWGESAAAAPAAPDLRYAGFWIRFVAYLIDAIPFGIVMSILGLGGGVTRTTTVDPATGASTQHVNWDLLHDGAGNGLFLVYLGVCWAVWGRTLGQRAIGLRVVAGDGSALSAGASALRVIGFIIAAIPCAIGLMWAGWADRKRGWHDMISGSVVVRRDA